MQIGIRLHDIKEAPLAQRLAIAREQGFTCCHLAPGKVISEYSVADGALTPGLAAYLRKVFAKNEIDIAVLGCYLNLATPDEAELAKTWNCYRAHLRFASLLGCGVVGTETGAVNTEYCYEERNHSEEALDIFVKNLEPVVEWAEKSGVILAIEPVVRHIVCNPKRAREVLDRIPSPNLQIIFDPVNLLDITNYQDRNEIFAEMIELLGEDIAVMHLKDFIIRDGDLISVAAGHGEMDYTRIMRFLKKEKPYIYATLEDSTPENACAARAAMQKAWEQA